jgi:hypothetical protein
MPAIATRQTKVGHSGKESILHEVTGDKNALTLCGIMGLNQFVESSWPSIKLLTQFPFRGQKFLTGTI